MDNQNFNQGFAPIISPNSRVLILGSFPSVISRQVGFYYGNRQNRFWNTLEKIFQTSAPTVQDKVNLVLSHNIALYDMYEKSNISGSSDACLNQTTAVTASLNPLFEIAPNLELIIFNGKKAYEAYMNEYAHLKIKAVCLPSTSSANPRFDFSLWEQALLPYLKK